MHQIRQNRIDQIKWLIQERYPNLHTFQEDSGCLTIKGWFPVRTNDVVIDRFLVDISVTKNFPIESPRVKELGGRIPADRHVNQDDGSLCLYTPLERWKFLPPTATIINFLDGPLNDHLFSQLYFESFGRWPFGERGHGALGVREYLAEELDIDSNDVASMRRLLEYLLKGSPKGHWDCFCGSKKKMRHCHLSKVLILHNNLTKDEIRKALKLLTPG